MGGAPFLEAAGLGLSHSDKMAKATVEILRADSTFSAWAEERIWRADLIRLDLGATAPFVAVGAMSWGTEFKIGCATKNVEVATILCYEVQLAGPLGDDQPTEAAIVQLWETILANNPLLQVPSFGVPLAQRLASFGTVALDRGDLDSKGVRVLQILSATYDVPWNSTEGRFEA